MVRVSITQPPALNVTLQETPPTEVELISRATAIEVGSAGIQGPTGQQGIPGAAGAFPNTFVDVDLNGSWTIPSENFHTVTLNREISDPGNNFDTTTSFYTVPSTGLYLIIARTRLPDNFGGTGYGIGVNIASNDGAYFQWNQIPGNASRSTVNYQRMAYFTAGQQLRLYAYGPNNIVFIAAGLNIVRIA